MNKQMIKKIIGDIMAVVMLLITVPQQDRD